MCLRTGRNDTGATVPSIVEPSGSNNDPFETADGYVWKFLFTISAIEANYFLSANYMPVSRIVGELDSDATGIQLKHKEIQDQAVPGMISSIIVLMVDLDILHLLLLLLLVMELQQQQLLQLILQQILVELLRLNSKTILLLYHILMGMIMAKSHYRAAVDQVLKLD